MKIFRLILWCVISVIVLPAFPIVAMIDVMVNADVKKTMSIMRDLYIDTPREILN